MKQEYKDFLQNVFHRDEAQIQYHRDPDYYSNRFRVLKETDTSIEYELDHYFLEKPIDSLLNNLMEWGLMITRLVIGSDPNDYDDTSLCIEISEIPMGK